ncbi:LamG domain-containing protein [Actinoplanes sp. NPDC051859]|uniref:LamG domain-containing protein n=1 Tax=Actinoplanes sp. NPDC051859 TaxID=3363909 RepID=UPI0037961C58
MRLTGRAVRRVRVPLVAALLVLPPVLIVPAQAAFTAQTSSGGSTFAASATFPGYATAVNGDSPALYHRTEEAATSSSNGVVADSSANARPGTNAGATNGPSTVWQFEEATGTTTADGSGLVNQGTLSGASWLRPGRLGGSAVTLDGVDDYIESAGPAVTTTGSYTAMAWVYLTDSSVNRYVLAQEGVNQSVFGVHAFVTGTGACGCWSVRYVDESGNGTRVNSSVPVALHTWVHLTTVRDVAAGKVYLYVNGQTAVNETAYSTTVNATGPLSVGRLKVDGAWSNYWKGAVDDVRTYNRAISSNDIRYLYEDAAAGHWNMNDAPGTSAASDVLGRSATLAGDATFAAGRLGNALQLDGTGDYALTSTMPAIDTKGDYTVTAWLYLTDNTIDRHAVAAEGNLQTAFAIQANGSTHKWRVRFATDDTSSATGSYINGISTVQTGTWTHVAFVRSGTTGNLYVNTALEGTGTAAAWAASDQIAKQLSVGRQLNNGNPQGYWKGGIDDVRLYSKALTATQITRLYRDKDIQYGAALTGGIPGALRGQAAGSAVAFAGWVNSYSNTQFPSVGDCTVEVWFRTGTNGGGQLVGYSSSQTSTTAPNADRMLYVDSGGRLSFGVGSSALRSPAAYQDGVWHHAAASVGPAGMKLYVDGVRVASDAAVTTGPTFAGYWRWGGAQLAGRPNRPATDYYIGTIDEVAVFPNQLTDQQISWHYAAGR